MILAYTRLEGNTRFSVLCFSDVRFFLSKTDKYLKETDCTLKDKYTKTQWRQLSASQANDKQVQRARMQGSAGC